MFVLDIRMRITCQGFSGCATLVLDVTLDDSRTCGGEALRATFAAVARHELIIVDDVSEEGLRDRIESYLSAALDHWLDLRGWMRG